MSKILHRDELIKEAALWRSRNLKVVLTNGCYDLLHIGHLHTFRQARQLGDLLVVGINSDQSVRSLKGSSRPLVPEQARAELVAALEPVDYTVIFPEITAEALIADLRPDFYVKGGDYQLENLPEAAVLRQYGIQCRFIPFIPGFSTSDLVRKIRNTESESGGARQ